MGNDHIIIFIIYILTMTKQIFCEENQKNNNAKNIKFNDNFLESSKNKNNTGLEEIKSQFQNPTEINQYFIPINYVVDENENIDDDKKYECFKLFLTLELTIDTDNNQIPLTFDKIKEKKAGIPDYCESEYNKFYISLHHGIIQHLKEKGKFNLKFDLSSESNIDLDFNTDKNDKKFVDNNKMESKSNDDELEQYYLKSRKDCVEYGLKSSSEDLIVCTKYE